MPKPAKSSASAATRKKHAKKSGKDDGPDIKPKSKGQKKLTKEEKKAKVKQYVPPPKPPAPAIPDPLDSQGLAHQLPAELVVTLRRLGKKDDVTRRKGLEELRDDWIRPMVQPKTSEDQELARELKESALLVAIPIWVSLTPECVVRTLTRPAVAPSCRPLAVTFTSHPHSTNPTRFPLLSSPSPGIFILSLTWLPTRKSSPRHYRLMDGRGC